MDEFENSSVQHSGAAPEDHALTEEERLLLEEADAQYIGTYSHTADGKGRLVIPQPFRQLLGSTFYIAPTRDMQAIALYSKLSWARTRHRYAELDPMNSDVLLFLEQFTALSFRDQECDAQGRILLPTMLRTLILDDEKDLIVSGEIDHVRIMSAEKYYARFRKVQTDMADIMKNMDRLRARELGF